MSAKSDIAPDERLFDRAPPADAAQDSVRGAIQLNSADHEPVEEGKRLIRLHGDRGQSLTDRIAQHFYRLTWNTPLHAFRLKGRYPLKLLAVPEDPIPGEIAAGDAIRAGYFRFRGLKAQLAKIDFAQLELAPAFADYLHSFAWLRDLAAVAPRQDVAPIAEGVTRKWLAQHAESVSEPAWRADNAGWRLLYWMAHAPLILSSSDLVYRSSVLNGIARTARHLDRSVEKCRPGVPQLVGWCGIVAAGLIIPGGEPRRIFGEAGLKRALETAFYADGGTVSRSPAAQLDAITALAMLIRVYEAVKEKPPEFLEEMLVLAVPALLGLTHGDGGLGNWQGSGATHHELVQAVVGASRVRTRPLKQARDWGYQRITAQRAIMIIDAAPPPVARLTEAGCASTLAFEFSHGKDRIIVNCGGAALTGALIPKDLADGLRTTAAHSTLTLANSNSTAINDNGTLGKGVVEVELDRRETEAGSRIEISHDGYSRRSGYIHRRLLILAASGHEVRGEDMLIPAPRKKPKGDLAFTVQFHLAHTVRANLTADGHGALLRIDSGPLWQFRCNGGTLVIEDSLWVDGDGRPHPTQVLILSGEAAAGGSSIGWILKHIG
jgi:uncharacterized heparinase superfamily protein